jgi:hypothetical protein
MYKLTPNPKYTYNPSFIMRFEDDECTKYDKIVHDIVKPDGEIKINSKLIARVYFQTIPCVELYHPTLMKVID